MDQRVLLNCFIFLLLAHFLCAGEWLRLVCLLLFISIFGLITSLLIWASFFLLL
jgi:hypothetical protein